MPAPATVVAGKPLISHNSWTDRARNPVKTSLDLWDSKESHVNDKNMPLRLKFLRKIYICALPYWNFSKIRSKCEYNPLRIPSSLSDPVFWRFADRRNSRKQDPFEKTPFGLFSRGKIWGQKVLVEKI